MTVKELIRELEQLNPDAEVRVVYADLGEGGNVSMEVTQVVGTELDVVEITNPDCLC